VRGRVGEGETKLLNAELLNWRGKEERGCEACVVVTLPI